VAGVARDCADGDLACYQTKLGDAEKNVVRKAAYMIAWTRQRERRARHGPAGSAPTTPTPSCGARSTSPSTALSPHGCAECITRLQAIITAEQGQESKSLMHLEAQMLIARLRARQ
jgi:hypothetical protein